ncbi:hypothetical protein [Catellatospora sp. TT07R-123]|uniref:hypothetical protein n=1 Tax=Catellatospora sp. TT07R-123 TaxID=2733863 RepID=UPI001BB3EC02|nr:hypothetical protein [Catellatospora sp. TT07R-123]
MNLTIEIARLYARVAAVPLKRWRASALLSKDRSRQTRERRQLDVFSAWVSLTIVFSVAFVVAALVCLGLGIHGSAADIILLPFIGLIVFTGVTCVVELLRTDAKPYDVLFGLAAASLLLMQLVGN